MTNNAPTRKWVGKQEPSTLAIAARRFQKATLTAALAGGYVVGSGAGATLIRSEPPTELVSGQLGYYNKKAPVVFPEGSASRKMLADVAQQIASGKTLEQVDGNTLRTLLNDLNKTPRQDDITGGPWGPVRGDMPVSYQNKDYSSPVVLVFNRDTGTIAAYRNIETNRRGTPGTVAESARAGVFSNKNTPDAKGRETIFRAAEMQVMAWDADLLGGYGLKNMSRQSGGQQPSSGQQFSSKKR